MVIYYEFVIQRNVKKMMNILILSISNATVQGSISQRQKSMANRFERALLDDENVPFAVLFVSRRKNQMLIGLWPTATHFIMLIIMAHLNSLLHTLSIDATQDEKGRKSLNRSETTSSLRYLFEKRSLPYERSSLTHQ